MIKLTREQLTAINSEEKEYKINAAAGSGKTTTLKYYAEMHPSENILYVAFNRSVRNEALSKFPRNVNVKTAHSLAFGGVRNFIKDRKIENIRTEDVVDYINVQTKDSIGKYILSKHVIDFLTCFFNSPIVDVNDKDLLESYEDTLEGESLEFFQKTGDKIPGIAQNIIVAMKDGKIPITHDFYLKLYQTRNPRLYYDTILFDEAQDASGSMLDVILNQDCKKIMVGDPHQQIYSFRYAVNSMEKLDFPEYMLSQSFRFGEDIADIAKTIIKQLKQEPIKIKGVKEKECKIEFYNQKPLDKKTAIIARTNVGIIEYLLLHFLDKNIKIYFEGGNVNGYIPPLFKIYDLINLDRGYRDRIRNSLIRSMKSLDDYKKYAQKASDAEALILINLYENFGYDSVYYLQMVKDMAVKYQEDADYTVSTVHKAKGMEYDTVYLLDDFVDDTAIEKHDFSPCIKEEFNILYVAVTRAKNKITLPPWLKSFYRPKSETKQISL